MLYIYTMKYRPVTVLVLLIAGALLALETSHMRITSGPYESEYPSLEWVGDVLAVAWMDGRDGNQELYFKLVDVEKNVMGSARRLTNSANWDYRPQLAWNGSSFGLLWMHERKVKRDIYFARLDTQGNFISSHMRLINQQRVEKDTQLAWTDSGYGFVYGDYRPGNLEIFYQALSEGGQPLGSAVRLTNTQGKTDLSRLVFTGSHYALSFLDDSEGTRQVYFMLFDPAGNVKALKKVSRIPSHCTLPSLARSGAGFGVAWCQNAGSAEQVFFAALDAGGRPVGEARTITSDSSLKYWAETASIDNGYGIAYYAGDRLYRKLNFCTLDLNGGVILSPRPVTPQRKAEAACPVIRIIRAADGLIIAWSDLGENLNSEIFITKIKL